MLQLSHRCSSLLDAGRVVGAARLDDLRAGRAGLVVAVAVILSRAVALLVVADVDDHAGGGGGGGVQLVLLSWESNTQNQATSSNRVATRQKGRTSQSRQRQTPSCIRAMEYLVPALRWHTAGRS